MTTIAITWWAAGSLAYCQGYLSHPRVRSTLEGASRAAQLSKRTPVWPPESPVGTISLCPETSDGPAGHDAGLVRSTARVQVP